MNKVTYRLRCFTPHGGPMMLLYEESGDVSELFPIALRVTLPIRETCLTEFMLVVAPRRAGQRDRMPRGEKLFEEDDVRPLGYLTANCRN